MNTFAGLCCPKCGEEDTLRLDLCDLDAITCTANDCEITVSEMREQIAKWQRLFAWIERAGE